MSSTLQTSSLSTADAQHIASLTVSTLSSIRTDESFKAFHDLVEHLRTLDGVDTPSLPRKRKVSKRIDKNGDTGYFSQSVEEFYHLQYFEAIDLVVTSIKDRFDQPGYSMYHNLEEVLVKGVARDDISKQLHDKSKLYTEIDISKREVHLSNASSHFKTNNITVSLDQCLQYLTSLSL